jgi:hypothetical protein
MLLFYCSVHTTSMRWKDACALQIPEDSEGEGRGIFQVTVSIFAGSSCHKS